MEKQFRTLVVASAATGIGLSDGMSYSDMQEVWTHVLGHDVWTHELADRALAARVHDTLLAAFPLLPTKDEATADWRVAAAKATAGYGETMTLTQGDGKRSENPIDSLRRIVGDDKMIIPIATA